MSEASEVHFRAFGFTVLRGAIDSVALRLEVERTLTETRARSHSTPLTTFQFAPMMTARTPCSLALVDELEATATRLLGGVVVPIRAKGVRYSGTTRWHRDSTRRLRSVGFIAYLDPLTAATGALRVLPASHRADAAEDVESVVDAAANAPSDHLVAEQVLATSPGDLIVMDEHLCHASQGGRERLQWRVDYVRVPESDAEREDLRAMVASIFASDWDGGYDPDLAPTYDSAWLSSQRPSVARLAALGVYEMARAQEVAMRARRSAAP